MKEAYIFDFDGVLVNTMEGHFGAYKRVLHEVNVPIDRAEFYRLAGKTGKEMIAHFAAKAKVEVDVEAVYVRKGALWPEYTGSVTSIEANIALLRCLRQAGHPTAIATGSSPGTILPIMDQFQIKVDAVVTAEDVTRGKPHPDLFLCAAERLGAAPGCCTVLEDSDAGVEAARAAGMNCLRFYYHD